ncbi:hypothetical protein Q5752_001031 [Cryptotrichosporon argae]
MPESKPAVFIHLHTLDLRTHDAPSLHLAHAASSPLSSRVTHFLPLYVFDSRQLDVSRLPGGASPRAARGPPTARQRSSQTASQTSAAGAPEPVGTWNAPTSRVAAFHRTSPHRLGFLLQAVFGLQATYRANGGDLLLAHGRADALVPRLIAAIQETHDVVGVGAQDEVSLEEADTLDALGRALGALDMPVPFTRHGSKVLVPTDKLPFAPADVPDVYTAFRKKVEGLGVERGGMLPEPLATAIYADGRIKIDGLKPFPAIPDIAGGGLLPASQDADELYRALAAPLFAAPPIAGWSSAASPDSIPRPHPSSAVPFSGAETTALERLEDYVGHADADAGGWAGGAKARRYKATRNGMLGEGFSTKFSTWLSLGAVSAREIGWRVGGLLEHVKDKDEHGNVYWILFELLWRDFFQHTTRKYSYFPHAGRGSKPGASAGTPRARPSSALFDPLGFSAHMATPPASGRPRVDDWAAPDWADKQDRARRWCEGRTGVPFIDGCMRELRETGWMSNRGRQNVASFLVKDLYVDWRVGAEFFEMHLVDYDTCSNWGNWQYQAGVGNGPRAARQFNPIKQAADYDASGAFVRTWVPEVAQLPDGLVQIPWRESAAPRFPIDW